jgi:deoxyribodipyrimidine photo-lyase
MIVASFLVKDLHIEWTYGARHFMRHLVDGDLASNQHGWQKFDPEGEYIRRYVPELRELSGKEIHEPWDRAEGLPDGYPERIVDHSTARTESLAAYQHLIQKN